jgi:hypothetical protein
MKKRLAPTVPIVGPKLEISYLLLAMKKGLAPTVPFVGPKLVINHSSIVGIPASPTIMQYILA